MDNTTFKILSINGTGSCGIDSLYELSEIEKKYCKDGLLLGDYFDILCGSHMAAPLCVAISYGIPIDKIIKKYERTIKSKQKTLFYNILTFFDMHSTENYICAKNAIYFLLPFEKQINNTIFVTNCDNDDKWIENDNNVRKIFNLNVNSDNPSLAIIIECMSKYVGVDKVYNNYALLDVDIKRKIINFDSLILFLTSFKLNTYFQKMNDLLLFLLQFKCVAFIFSVLNEFIKNSNFLMSIKNFVYLFFITIYNNFIIHFCTIINIKINILLKLYEKMISSNNTSVYSKRLSDVNKNIYVNISDTTNEISNISDFFLNHKTYK